MCSKTGGDRSRQYNRGALQFPQLCSSSTDTVLAQLGLEMKMESSAHEGRVFWGYNVISVLAITVGAPPPQIALNFWALGFISGGEEEEVTLPISWRIPVMNLQLRTMETLLLGLRFLRGNGSQKPSGEEGEEGIPEQIDR